MASVLSSLACSLAALGALGAAAAAAAAAEFEEVAGGADESCSNWVESDNIRRVPYGMLALCAEVTAASPACGDFFSFSPGEPGGEGSCKCVEAGDVCEARASDEGFQLYQITAGKGEGEAPSIALAESEVDVPMNAAGQPCRSLSDHCCNDEDYCCDPLVASWDDGNMPSMTMCLGSPPVGTCGFRFLCGDGIVPLASSSTEDEDDDDEDAKSEWCSQGKYECQGVFEAGGHSVGHCDIEYGCVYNDSTSPASCPCGEGNGDADEEDDEGNIPSQCSQGKYDCQGAFEAGDRSYSYCDTEYGCVYNDSTSPASCPCGAGDGDANEEDEDDDDGSLGVVEIKEVEGGSNKSCINWVRSKNVQRVPYNRLTLCAKVAAASPACGDFFSFSPGEPDGEGSCKCVEAGDVCEARVSDEGFQLYQITAGTGAGEAPSIALSESEAAVPTNAAGEPCRSLGDHCCNDEDYCCDPLFASWGDGDAATMTTCLGSPPVGTCGNRFLCGDGIVPLASSNVVDDGGGGGGGDGEDGDGGVQPTGNECREEKYDCQGVFEAANRGYSHCDIEYGCFYDRSTTPASCPCGEGESVSAAGSLRRAFGFFEAWAALLAMASLPLRLGGPA